MEFNKRSSDEEEVGGPCSKVLKMVNSLEESSIEDEDDAYDLNFEKLIGNEVVRQPPAGLEAATCWRLPVKPHTTPIIRNPTELSRIFDKLESMLNYKDLKVLRSVSKKCEEVVLKHKFIRKTKFKVWDDRTTALQLHRMRFQPKHVKVQQFVCVYLEESVTEKDLPKDCMQILNDMLGFRILKGDGTQGRPVYSIDEMQAVLQLCEDIDTLEIEGAKASCKKLKKFEHLFPPTKDLLAAPQSLKSLVIHGHVLFENEYGVHEDARTTIAVEQLTLKGHCCSIIRHVQHFKNLSSISVDFSNLDLSPMKYTKLYSIQMREIMANHSSTLQRIHLDGAPKFEKMFAFVNLAENKFPRLEYFGISFMEHEESSLNHFLLSHFAGLKELYLQYLKSSRAHTTELPKKLLHFLENARSSKLLTLQLHYPVDKRPDEAWLEDHSTSLNLRNLSSLQEFVLDFGKLGGVSFGVQDLPPSLQRIVVNPSYQIQDRLLPGENIEDLRKILPNLQHWELRACRSFNGGYHDIVIS